MYSPPEKAALMSADTPVRPEWAPMLRIGGGPGAGKSTLSWRLSRALDLPLHRVDLWAYDHHARMPAPRLAPGHDLSQQRRYENQAAARQGRLWMQDAGLAVMPDYPVRLRMRDERVRRDLAGHARRLRGQNRFAAPVDRPRPRLIAHGAG
jgi:hypothetical protein